MNENCAHLCCRARGFNEKFVCTACGRTFTAHELMELFEKRKSAQETLDEELKNIHSGFGK